VLKKSRKPKSAAQTARVATAASNGRSTVVALANASDLIISRVRALRGPNYWRLAPIVACDLKLGSLEELCSDEIPGFNDRLLRFLPSLHQHPCSRGEEGGFVDRLIEGTHLPHILEHVALELQTLAGSDVSFGRVVQSGDPGTWWVIVAYDEEEVGVDSVYEGARILRASIAGEDLDVGEIIAELQDLYERVRLGP